MVYYLGVDLSWFGRELAGYTKGNKAIAYQYDVDGMRYMKTVSVNGTETARYDYVYSDGTLILLNYTANGVANTARFVYDSFGEPRGFILNDSATYLYLKNGQGDITAIVGETGEILVRYEYNAWGAVEFVVPFGVDPAVTSKLATVSPFTYRGYCYDYDIGMYYLQSRYYDPQICRFINADSTDYLGATGTVLSYNLFAYCENDGVNNVDPKGTYIFFSFSGKNKNANRKNIAKKLFQSSNYPYFKNTYTNYVFFNSKHVPYTKRIATYKYKTTFYDKYEKSYNVVYTMWNNNRYRVVGTFLYKTVIQWKSFIISRHANIYTQIKRSLSKSKKMPGTIFDTVIDLLPEVLKGRKIENKVTVIGWINTILDYMNDYRDSLDRYIESCIYNKKDETGVMIAWSIQYQSYYKFKKGYGWKTNTRKTIYDYF